MRDPSNAAMSAPLLPGPPVSGRRLVVPAAVEGQRCVSLHIPRASAAFCCCFLLRRTLSSAASCRPAAAAAHPPLLPPLPLTPMHHPVHSMCSLLAIGAPMIAEELLTYASTLVSLAYAGRLPVAPGGVHPLSAFALSRSLTNITGRSTNQLFNQSINQSQVEWTGDAWTGMGTGATGLQGGGRPSRRAATGSPRANHAPQALRC